MNTRLIAISISLLGLIGSPVFADTLYKHQHHKKYYHHIYHHWDEINQNIDMNKPMPEWFDRIGISGGINFDTGKWGSRSVTNQALQDKEKGAGGGSAYSSTLAQVKDGYTGENTKRFSINNAYLNVVANVNEWSHALAVISYNDESLWYDQAYTAYLNNRSLNLGALNQRLSLEQAVIHFGNFACTPLFIEVGKQFIDYGRYTVHPITASMTQALTETLRNAIKLGFVTAMGIQGSAYMFQNGLYSNTDVVNQEATLNYGAALGYAHLNDHLGYDIGLGYMYNMMGVNNVSAIIANRVVYAGYVNRVSAFAAYADVNYEAFTVGARYTYAVQRFNPIDLPKSLHHLAQGAEPWAAGIQGGYRFNDWGKNQNLYLGYQVSYDTVFLNLPHNRYVVGYNIDVLKNTRLSAEWDHDITWNGSNGGPSGGNSNLVSLRAAVKFG